MERRAAALLVALHWLPARDVGRLGRVSRGMRALVCGDDAQPVWRAAAVREWGPRVPTTLTPRDGVDDLAAVAGLKDVGVAPAASQTWRSYYVARCACWQPVRSPWGLIQERYGGAVWPLVAACLLCSRTSGSAVVHDTIDACLTRWPTPSAVLAAPLEDLAAALLPLGLHRERVLPRAAAGFLSPVWTGLPVRALYGCGPFVDASYRVFCMGAAAAVAREADADATVRAYARWAAAAAAAPVAAAAAAAAPAAASAAAVASAAVATSRGAPLAGVKRRAGRAAAAAPASGAQPPPPRRARRDTTAAPAPARRSARLSRR